MVTIHAMTLAEFIAQEQMTPAEFARRSGLSKQTVHKYLNGLRVPRPEQMAAITAATDGKVTGSDCYAAYVPKAERERVAA